jgi:tRNA threonylcarbamoyladenosine biosynthesis protein TsaB
MNVEELNESIQHPTLICGELTEGDRGVLGRKYKNAVLLSAAWCTRRPAILAELAWARWQAGEVNEAKSLAPIYLQAGETVS